ncbi:sushi domain-containing protein 2-like isoform X1 [Mercenaria mercenaria]|uniref:sushi domain-containing protein 2-like isoform X1 n=1 Tax=Mercenaria mercenaria TaxID=6596 RepID=UPI00234E5928|nr:sushi domain-containing protein 2-like isoform X1 [Mercenaria mercenaria]
MVMAREMLTAFILMFGIQAKIGGYASENGSHVCRRITADIEIKNLILKYQHTATPCACFEQKMALDYSFQKIGNCYKQWFSENGLKQMCCYDQYGSLLFGPNNGGYLIPDILESNIEDIHEACCKDSDLCETFYKFFPSNNCTGSTDVVHATSWGDPEITTVDQHTYSFNGHGEYTFLETSGKLLQIQARTDFLIKGNQDSTLFVVFVLADNIKNDIITIVYNRNDKTLNLFQHDGSLWANSKDCKNNPKPSGKAGFYLFCSEPFSFGIMLTQKTNIQRLTFHGGDSMSVVVDSKKNVTRFRGLAGNLEHGYYIYGNGSKVSINATERDMFYFGESWTVSQDDSKFNYSITGGNFTYWNGNHTRPQFLQEIAEKGDLDKLFKGFSDANITKFNETCRNFWDKKPNNVLLLLLKQEM